VSDNFALIMNIHIFVWMNTFILCNIENKDWALTACTLLLYRRSVRNLRPEVKSFGMSRALPGISARNLENVSVCVFLVDDRWWPW
jgi:uncharacterized membrane protein YoaT (DUF817 family)